MEHNYFVHPTADIEDDVTIGEGTHIWRFSCVRQNAQIGKNCIIGQNVYIDKNVVIGNKVKLQNNVSLYDGVVLEDYVFVGPSAVFTNVLNPRAHIERKTEFKTTLVKKGATIGANATILCGIAIGQFAFIAAGALVRTDVPDFALMMGVPARQAGWMCQCGRRLPFRDQPTTQCRLCGAVYEQPNPNRINLITPPTSIGSEIF